MKVLIPGALRSYTRASEVEAEGGTLLVASTPGRGTCLQVTLPEQAPSAPADA